MTAPNTETEPNTANLPKPPSTPRMAITVDYERYAHMLDDPSLSETAKREFLQTLWNVIVALIDVGVAVHAKNDTDQSCGQLSPCGDADPTAEKSAVHCKDHLANQPFNSAAFGEERGA